MAEPGYFHRALELTSGVDASAERVLAAVRTR
jgi:hypothetical protein